MKASPGKPHFQGPALMIAIDRGLTVCGVAALALLAPVPGDCDATEPRHLVGWYYHRHGIYLPNTDQQIT
jgi:hypothetical protein